MCSECLRPRLLHAKHKLSWPDKQAVASAVKEVLYSCGASLKEILPEGVDSELVSTSAVVCQWKYRTIPAGHLHSLCIQFETG